MAVAVDRFTLDTSVFLQCRHLRDIADWQPVSEAAEIQLYPTPTTISEIDRLKSDGSGRRAKRARSAADLFRQCLDAGAGGVVLREKPSRILLRLPQPLDDTERDRTEAISNADRRIIEETRALSKQLPGLRLLTRDVGMEIRAMQAQVAAMRVPESWEAEPEPDPLQREVQDLKKQISKLSNSHTQLSIAMEGLNDAGHLELAYVEYPELPAGEAANLAAIIAQREEVEQAEYAARVRINVSEIEKTMARAGYGTVVTPADVEAHRQLLDKWIGKVAAITQHIPPLASFAYNMRVVTLEVANGGSIPAKDIEIQVSARGAVKIVNEGAPKVMWGCGLDDLPALQATAELSVKFVPKRGWANRPKNRWDLDFPHLALPPISSPFNRDPDAFYRCSVEGDEDDEDDGEQRKGWVESESGIVFNRDNLRHTRSGIVRFVIIPVLGNGDSGALDIEMHAENLPEPVSMTVPVRMVSETGDSVAKAREIAAYWRDNLPEYDDDD